MSLKRNIEGVDAAKRLKQESREPLTICTWNVDGLTPRLNVSLLVNLYKIHFAIFADLSLML
jgi:hypothetical protein